MTGTAGKQGRSSVNLFAVEPKDFSFSLSISTPSLSLSLLSSLSLSSRTDRGGRSQSAHTLQLASITWSPQIPKLVERRKSSKSFTGPRSVTE